MTIIIIIMIIIIIIIIVVVFNLKPGLDASVVRG